MRQDPPNLTDLVRVREQLAAAPPEVVLADLLDKLGDDPEVLADVSRLMLESTAQHIDALADSCEKLDFSAVQRGAHAFKGSVCNFTVGPTWQLAAGLEFAAQSEDAAAVQHLYAALRQAAARFADELESLANPDVDTGA